MKKYKGFVLTCHEAGDNLKELQLLFDDGWMPERESTFSNPSAVAFTYKVNKNVPTVDRYLFILLSKGEVELDDFGEPKF